MNAGSTCPEPIVLEQLTLGRLSATDSAKWEQHVTGCPHCVATLNVLPAADDLVRAMRTREAPARPSYQHLLEALTPALKRLRPTQPTTPWAVCDSAGTSDHLPEGKSGSFPFLQPAQGSGEIGWLGGYRVLELLGQGGMGRVYRAVDVALKRHVALKVILPGSMRSTEARDRFLREAQALAALEHDHIVTIYQVGEDQGVPFLAMQLLRGETLQQRLERAKGPLAEDEVLRLGREIALGLDVAHKRGIIHRDIKPSNLFLVSDGAETEESSFTTSPRLKILDFGLAHAPKEAPDDESQPNRLVGTPAYMSPEQTRGQPVDARSDLFSLGCVLYQLATGQRPFSTTDLVGLLFAIATEEAVPPRAINPAVSAALEDLIVRLMRKDPEERPASAAAVIEEIRALEDLRRPKPSRRRWLLGTATAVLVAAAFTAWAASVWLQRPRDPGDVTFDYDEQPDGRLALKLGDAPEHIIDVNKARTVSLLPGDYAVRPLADPGKRTLRPGRVLVKSGEKTRVTVRLVGEIDGRIMHSLPVRGLALSPRKDKPVVLSAGGDRCLFSWEPGSKDRPLTMCYPEYPFSCLALAPDGRTLAAGCGDTTRKDGNRVQYLDADKLAPRPDGFLCDSQVNALAYSPDGAWLFVGLNNGSLLLRDSQTGAPVATRDKAHEGGAFAVAFLPDGKRLLTAGWDGVLAEWAIARMGAVVEMTPVQTLKGHKGVVRGLAVLPEGKLAVSAGIDNTIRLWDLAAGKSRATLNAPQPIATLALSPDGRRLLTGDSGGTVRLWDLGASEEIHAFTGHTKTVSALAFTSDGQRAVSGDERGALIYWRLP